MPANNYVYEQVRSRIGNSVTITIGGDPTSFRGKLIAIRPEGTDNADAGVATAVSDEITLVVHVNRQKS
jgi:hypothetical protein